MSQIAVIEAGGRQYLVKSGDRIQLRHVQTDDKKMQFKDLLAGQKVSATVIESRRLPKVAVRKFRPKVRYLKRKSSRDHVVEVTITKIG